MDISPEVFLIFLDLLSEFGEGSVLLLKSLDLHFQLNQSLPQLSRLDLLAWGRGNTHTHTQKTEITYCKPTEYLIFDFSPDLEKQ